MHPEKSGVVYCKDNRRQKDDPRIQFTFLGYTFRPRGAQAPNGEVWTGFMPAVSAMAIKRMRRTLRAWQLPRQTSVGLHELAQRYNTTLRGWLTYYGRFYKSAMRAVGDHFDRGLLAWPPEISQVCGTSALGSPLADENGQPTPSVVHPLARPWQIHGPGDGSRMTRECHVRFCEGLWVKLPRSTLQS
jgi:hypothetical protein